MAVINKIHFPAWTKVGSSASVNTKLFLHVRFLLAPLREGLNDLIEGHPILMPENGKYQGLSRLLLCFNALHSGCVDVEILRYIAHRAASRKR